MWDKNKIDERKPNERYFWTPKKEMLLLVAKDKYKECPRDDENYGTNEFVIGYESPDHGAYSEYFGSQADVQVYRVHVAIPFWKPFTMYDAKNNIRPLNGNEYKLAKLKISY